MKQSTLHAHAVVLDITSLILDADMLSKNHTQGQHYVDFVWFSVKKQRCHDKESPLRQYHNISEEKRCYCVNL